MANEFVNISFETSLENMDEIYDALRAAGEFMFPNKAVSVVVSTSLGDRKVVR